jgi:hypothetical protein
MSIELSHDSSRRTFADFFRYGFRPNLRITLGVKGVILVYVFSARVSNILWKGCKALQLVQRVQPFMLYGWLFSLNLSSLSLSSIVRWFEVFLDLVGHSGKCLEVSSRTTDVISRARRSSIADLGSFFDSFSARQSSIPVFTSRAFGFSGFLWIPKGQAQQKSDRETC